MSQNIPFVVHVTDTRITQYIIHADDPGAAIRECAGRGVLVHTTGDVRAQALPITESNYDKAMEGAVVFSVDVTPPPVTSQV
jgi:hypothetical protein